MSNGKIHVSATLGSSVGILSGGLASFVFYPEQLLVMAVGAIFGIAFSPDADVDAGNISNYFARKIKLDWLFRTFMYSYSVSIKHRSPLSHWPILGTLVRVVYLFCPIVILVISDQPRNLLKIVPMVLVSQVIALVLWAVVFVLWWYNFDFFYWGLPLLVGLGVSDFLHYLFDVF